MTATGRFVLSIYSLVAVTVLVMFSVRKVAREEAEGWELALLIPTLIFLINII
ncbi:hypothetical protein [Clostridium rectalis]|uniref:hypothetical protein n=1 Tax=Clostridium rectalis TaxID=2040295 RepID=UPI0013DE45B9|nr:hypothetical protein [Clostridium rectalis]